MCKIFCDIQNNPFLKIRFGTFYTFSFFSGSQGNFLVDDMQDLQSKVNYFLIIFFPKMFILKINRFPEKKNYFQHFQKRPSFLKNFFLNFVDAFFLFFFAPIMMGFFYTSGMILSRVVVSDFACGEQQPRPSI